LAAKAGSRAWKATLPPKRFTWRDSRCPSLVEGGALRLRDFRA
jgi:hypothetical protein